MSSSLSSSARRLPHEGWVVVQKSAFDGHFYIVHEGTKERARLPDEAVGDIEVSYFQGGDAFLYDEAKGQWHVAHLLTHDWRLSPSSLGGSVLGSGIALPHTCSRVPYVFERACHK